ncbi:ASPIC and UnbV [Falsiruegeria litorea R37]|uniref:ASPIC and UnbV n=1 Tax=Falsiruegeria litorea R37 TaxID=1200284 RepID=A0A1Y5T115_9RHOB|nr:CRTAC1 family protein [Falsiruegeria litorea]SLN53485.1 ASPIC and UnbV [Falsiruegeria litorea R37]
MPREVLSLLLPLIASTATADITFTPVKMPEHQYTGGWEHFVGGGLASFDCNDDHLPELFAAGGQAPALLLRNTSSAGGAIQFDADTPDSLRQTGVIGAYPLDIDADGQMDLVLLRVGQNRLLKGGPDCSFAPFTELDFRSDERWTTAFSATWEIEQSLPTLAFGNYVDRSDPDGPFRACDINLLYRPDATRYAHPTVLEPGYCPLSMLFSDWGRTGQTDLRISNDRHYYVDGGAEQLWRLSPDLRLYDESDGWQDHKLWGMGIAARDLDHDGQQEVFLTSMGDQRLQRLTGPGPRFEDVPYTLGTTAHRPYSGGDGRPSTGWHVAFGDVQNDGLDDVFISKGNVEQMPGSAMDDPNNLLIQNSDGTFSEAGDLAGLDSLHRGRGAAMVDLNADGLLDIAVVNRRAPLEVWQNTSQNTGAWLALSITQPGPNRNGVGSWIEVSTDLASGFWMAREITRGGGHAGGSAGFEHFGLGKANTAFVRVTWPDGTISNVIEVMPNQSLTFNRAGNDLLVSN